MEFISLDIISRLPAKEQIKIKIGIIETNELSMIPSSYLPDVHSKDYYFVSYSHLDYKNVYPDIFALQAEGLNIWYDRGIPGGKDWRDVANKFMAPNICRGVLFYISENSLLSDAIFEEMKYAKSRGKSYICVNLPFTSDYRHNGASVKGKTFSAKTMIDILIENGVDIPQEKVDFIDSLMPESVLYLPLSMEGKGKIEKILSSTPDMPKVITTYKEKGWYSADYASDFLIDSLELKDFDAFKSKPLAKTAIGRCAFSNCEFLTSVNTSAHSINDYAFFHCVNLVSFKNYPNPNSDKIICWNASFMRCKNLVDIDIGQFAFIGDEAFSTCESLEEIELHATKVGRSAFYRCYALRRVKIGKEVEELGQFCFDRCSSLEEFIVDEDNPCFYSKDGDLYDKKTGSLLYKKSTK